MGICTLKLYQVQAKMVPGTGENGTWYREGGTEKGDLI